MLERGLGYYNEKEVPTGIIIKLVTRQPIALCVYVSVFDGH